MQPIIQARSNFIKYVLTRYDIHDKSTVWLLNLIKDKEEILTHLQFKQTTHLNDQLIIFDNFKIHLILSHGIYTDSDVIFHYLLQNTQLLYVNLLFIDKKYDALCQQELMQRIDLLMMEEEDIQIAVLDYQLDLFEILNQPALSSYLYEQIDNAIEDTLISRNKIRFERLTQLKIDLEERRHVI